MSNKKQLMAVLDAKPHLRKYLFMRGYLMTTQVQVQQGYPFYDSWRHYSFDKYHVYVHPDQTFYCVENEDIICFLIGHAYNPFTMDISETNILQSMADTDHQGRIQILNQITGIFTIGWIENGTISLATDCAGMQSAYYGDVNGQFYLSSHMQLIGDLCDLQQSDYVKELTAYRFYRYYGAFLPGDLSAFDELKRIVPNTLVSCTANRFSVGRFYPDRSLVMRTTEREYDEGIRLIADLLHKNMELISRKWGNPAISMTGGMDSKATVAAANGIYDRFGYFSYVSIPGEKIDADAAHRIADAIGVNHWIDSIPDNDDAFDDIHEIALLLQHNFGNIGPVNPNDVRKRAFYSRHAPEKFDVEVKSWVSEIGRANYYKKFGFRKMPKHLNPRQMTSMYKLFLHNRKLVRQTDDIFADYIRKYDFENIYNFDASDLFLWEIRYGSWGGQVITCEHKFSFDITIPYNNRQLMELFLSLPLDRRISDQVHYDLIRHLNPAIDKTGITITNYNETKTRMYKEKLYYLVHTHLPF